MMLLDSNILIYYLEGKENIRSFLENAKLTLYISVISFSELLSKPSLKQKEIRLIKKFLDQFKLIDCDEIIAEEAAALKRKYGLKLPDAIIAASARIYNLTLLSEDTVFNKVEELEIITTRRA